ncbi:MAG: hypothetical protein DMF31_10020, partial [Verrucomicrobia bacterium]
DFILNRERLLKVVPIIVHYAEFKRWDGSEQPLKLACSIRAVAKLVCQTKFLRAATHQQAYPKDLESATEINAQNAQRYGYFCLTSLLRPALGIALVDVDWQQM